MPSTKQHSRSTAPTQVWDQKIRRAPAPHARTLRRDKVSVVTSGFGGKFVPLKMIPLLREDGVVNTRLTVSFQMAELSNMILNPVRASAVAYYVPKLALERFADMGTIDRSYNGEQEIDGTTVPWFETYAPGAAEEVLKTLGLHHSSGGTPNTDYLESYNVLWNYIATQRSPSLTMRGRLDETLAPAFWEHTQMQHVKPTFDDAMMDGRVPLGFANGTQMLPVLGIGQNNFAAGTPKAVDYTQSDGTTFNPGYNIDASTGFDVAIKGGPGPDFVPQIFAELQEQSVQVSLADLDLARETAAWARLRNQYQGVPEEYLMDQLLAGIRINDHALRYPMLLDHKETIFGLTERYATDAENLDKSVADGKASLGLSLNLPQTTCGGVIVVAAQVLPEQLYERQRDYFLMAQTVEELPNRISDELDPQPVEMVKNVEIDEKHTLPDDLFGYAPLNHRWMRDAPNVGGKYYKDDPQAPWTEDRNRIWETGVVDAQLGPDFYLATTLAHDVFADSNTDPFEFWVSGDANISGLTYFGPQLLEGSDDYNKVLEKVDQERLKGDGTDT